MRRALMTIGPAVVLLALAGCGQAREAGPSTTVQRPVSGITAVQLETSGDLAINVGDGESLTIEAGTNVVDGLTSDVVDGTLVLGGADGVWFGGSIRYTLTIPSLDRIVLEGSGSASGSGVLTGDATVIVSGSGSATVTDVRLTGLSTELSGSGAIRVTGASETLSVNISGSGDFDGSGLAAQEATVEVSGSGQARVDVSGTLTATVSGSGDVVYTGDPGVVHPSRSGSGEIVPG